MCGLDRPHDEPHRRTGRALARCHNVADLQALARRRLPRAVFDYLDGGAEDEFTLSRNRYAFERYALVPNALVDVGKIELATTVLGQRIELPLVLGPCGLARLIHREGDAHLGNFRWYNAPDRTPVFDLNDFDETVSGPFDSDLCCRRGRPQLRHSG